MKFKGIELKEGNDSEAELLINVELLKEINDEDELEEYIDSLEERMCNLFEDFNYNVYSEAVADNLIQVRTDDITFDEKGIQIIQNMFSTIVSENMEDIKVTVGVHVNGDTWFKRKDGTEYNEDSVTMEDFLNNIEI